jgi:hypothetical protein
MLTLIKLPPFRPRAGGAAGYSRLMGRDKNGTHAKLLYVKPPQWSRHRHTVGQGN